MPKPPADIYRLKKVTRAVLAKLEESLAETGSATDSDRQKRHERLFGAKGSLAGTLVLLTDLTLKLRQAEEAQAAARGSGTSESQPLSPADIVIIEAFLKRKEKQEAMANDTSGAGI